MRRFAKTVVKVLLSYVEIVKIDFPEQMKTERIVSSQAARRCCNLETIIWPVICQKPCKFQFSICIYHLKACVLMNNIQQLRIQLEKMFESMGGEKLEEDAANILKDLQQNLNNILDELALQFANRFESNKNSLNQANCLNF